jgi:diketogulonate reductase-like aldo/keto reductase
MSNSLNLTRRRFLRAAAGLGSLAAIPTQLLAEVAHSLSRQVLPTRAIPVSGEQIPVVGFGSSKSVLESPTEGTAPIANVLRMLREYGGRVVDTSPRSEAIDLEFGRVLQEAEAIAPLFIAAKIYTDGAENGIAQFRQTQRLYGRRTVDLLQVESVRDLETHWPNVRAWKESGEARYIGVTVFLDRDHEALEAFMRRESFDFVHVNYSVVETASASRLLPLAQDRGMAVLINRPFMNGDYFRRVENRPLPEWAADFDCVSWAQFSVKYVLSHPAVTCVLTETTNPLHMEENVQAGFGRLPDPNTRIRMRDLMREV